MKLVEGESFYQLVPRHTAGNYTPNQNQRLFFKTEDEVISYFEKEPFLIEYSLVKIINYIAE